MRFILPILITIFSYPLVSGENTAPEVDLGFEVFRDQCMACHLQTGMGILAMNAPSIAGLPRWYVADQLRKFRTDQRGYHVDDVAGKLMQANAVVLDERSIAFVGRHIENLALNPNRNTLGNETDPTTEVLYLENCASCHGMKGEGDRKHRAPPLTSQQDWYLLKQWENFQSSKREHLGYDPPTRLSDDYLQAIVAWLAMLPVENN